MNNHTALLVIDVQKGLDSPSLGKRNNPDAERNIATLLSFWRENDWPIIHIKHNSLTPNSPLKEGQSGNEIKSEALPFADEKIFSKNVNSAFIGTKLETYLHKHNIDNLVITGLTTDHCVSTTTRMASNLGFNVTLVSDATATHERHSFDGKHYPAEEIHQINLASLHEEFCMVKSSADIFNNS